MNKQKIQHVVERVIALQRITRSTTMKTARSQTALLATLNESELAEAALRISQAGQ